MSNQQGTITIPKEMVINQLSDQDKEKFENAEFNRRKRELHDKVQKDVQDPNTTTILFMRRRVSEILFKLDDREILYALHQEDLQDIRLVEIKLLLPYLKILLIPKDETKPETSYNYNIEGSKLREFDMTYVDSCTDCMNPRNPMDRTMAI